MLRLNPRLERFHEELTGFLRSNFRSQKGENEEFTGVSDDMNNAFAGEKGKSKRSGHCESGLGPHLYRMPVSSGQ